VTAPPGFSGVPASPLLGAVCPYWPPDACWSRASRDRQAGTGAGIQQPGLGAPQLDDSARPVQARAGALAERPGDVGVTEQQQTSSGIAGPQLRLPRRLRRLGHISGWIIEGAVRHHHAVRERHLQRQAAQIAARLGIEHLARPAERRARQPGAHGRKPSDRDQLMVACDGVERQRRSGRRRHWGTARSRLCPPRHRYRSTPLRSSSAIARSSTGRFPWMSDRTP
jgi:hypothetical protein